MNKHSEKPEKNINNFNEDVINHGGYEYTNINKLSAHLANKRISEAIHNSINFHGKTVLDIGCGDGSYTAEIAKAGARHVHGIDAADIAIQNASTKFREIKNISFSVCNIYELEKSQEKHDIAVLRGILHHLYDAPKAIEQVCKIANTIIVLEPNGYNPILKIIEKTSTYHINHEEKSYFPHTIDNWFIAHGGKIEDKKYLGIVPMFCPDWMCKGLKLIEPLIEVIPLVRSISCGQYLQRVEMKK